MNTIKTPSPVLREVLIQFSVEQDTPDQQLLDSYVERYPQFESQLRSLASQLVDDRLEVCDQETISSSDIEEAAISVSAFQTRYFERTGCVFGESHEDVHTIENKLISLGKPAYKGLAVRLGINTVVLNQLRDREIEPATISQRFRRRLATEFNVSIEAILQFLSLPSAVSPTASFKADDKPQSTSKESFEHALMHSGLSEDQIKSLLD
ncbi:hypothetical protein P5W99_36625 [Paraburkholderia sp. A3BS-1L]|uniref:hypothetical protein n=1 Tax=Paraburkholderia sp. A3BS-1L TaxID=3028375 RepID=UPI003DA9F219